MLAKWVNCAQVFAPRADTHGVSIRGFDYTSDTDGLADWIVEVNVAVQTMRSADFAGWGVVRSLVRYST